MTTRNEPLDWATPLFGILCVVCVGFAWLTTWFVSMNFWFGTDSVDKAFLGTLMATWGAPVVTPGMAAVATYLWHNTKYSRLLAILPVIAMVASAFSATWIFWFFAR